MKNECEERVMKKKKKKELRALLPESLFDAIKSLADKRSMSLTKQVMKLLIKGVLNDENIKEKFPEVWKEVEEFNRLWEAKMTKPTMEPYVRAVFRRNPKISGYYVYRLLERKFGIIATRQIKILVQRVKKRVREQLRYERKKDETDENFQN